MKPASPTKSANHIAVFQEASIRRVWHNEEWWFALTDVIVVLTDSADPRQYIKKMRSRDPALDVNWGTTCTPLALRAPDGKMRETNCANTEGLFRIIQSIPSPKAEPFKRWLARVGYERVQEIENPELASARARELYQAKGYPQAWIEKRLRSISVRGELTHASFNTRQHQMNSEHVISNEHITNNKAVRTPCYSAASAPKRCHLQKM
jgi:DNA-damage-inducible protein D